MYINILISLILFAFCLALVIIVLRAGPEKLTHRIISLFLLLISIYGLILSRMLISPQHYAIYYLKGITIIIASSAVLFHHFTSLYAGIRQKKGIIPATYLYLLLFILITTATNIIIKDVSITQNGRGAVGGIPLLLGMMPACLLIILAGINFYRALRYSPILTEKNRYYYLIIGTGIYFSGVICDLLYFYGVPVLPSSILSYLLCCSILSLAILLPQILDIRLVLRRGMGFLIIGAIMAIPYIGIVAAVSQTKGGFFPVWGYILLLLILAFALQPVQKLIQSWIDNRFYRGRLEFFQSLQEFGHGTRGIANLEDISRLLVNTLALAMGTNKVGLFLALPDAGNFSLISCTAPTSSSTIKTGSPLIQWLMYNSACYRADFHTVPLLQVMPGQDRKLITVELDAELVIPLKVKTELIGILVLGSRQNGGTYSGDELGLLFSTLPKIAVSLNNARLYDKEKRHREKMGLIVKDLERQNQEKNKVVADMSHDMMTPLTSILLSSELIEKMREPSDSASLSKLVNSVDSSARSVIRRISELSDYIKMERIQPKLNIQPVDILFAVGEVASSTFPLLQSKQQRLSLEISSLPPAKADADRVEQILFNLVSNASKYSPEKSTIRIGANVKDSRIEIEVKDQAPPVDPDEHQLIFNPYYRGRNAGFAKGWGLGLTICKRLVELQGGTIGVKSTPGGNCFHFSLPLANGLNKNTKSEDTPYKKTTISSQ